MNKFTFVLPDGQLFELKGTADTTREQAERIFNEQLAAGALTGLRRGDTIENVEAKIVDFTLSRLDRGTAGVDDLPLLAINNQGIISALPIVEAPIENPIDVADFLAQTPPAPVGPLTTPQVQALMAAIANDPGPGVGKYGLTIPQLELGGILKPGTGCRFAGIPNTPDATAQPIPDNFLEVLASPSVWTGKYNIVSLDDLLANEATQDRIQEGLIRSSYDTLVQTGQIQTTSSATTPPVGTVYNALGSNLTTALALGTTVVGALSTVNFSAIGSSITGALNGFGKGVSTIASKIGNLSFDSFSTAGVGSLSLNKLTGGISNLAGRGVAELGGLLTNASKFGVNTATQWAKGLNPAGLTNQLNGAFKQGQFSVNFADFKLPTTVAGFAPAAGFTGTTNRQTVDLTTAKLIGSSKIPTPSFGATSIDDSMGGIGASLGSINPASFSSALGGLNISSITSQVSGLTSQVPGLSSVTGSLGSLTGQMPSVSGRGPLTSFGQTVAGPSGLPTSIGGVTTGSTFSVGTNTTDLAARRAAIDNVELKKGIYEVAKAEYGISSTQAQQAFAEYKAALANLDNFA